MSDQTVIKSTLEPQGRQEKNGLLCYQKRNAKSNQDSEDSTRYYL